MATFFQNSLIQRNTVTSGIPQLNIQVAAIGFGSYLTNILPPDIAVAAGAFAASMQQIKNIESIPIEKFAQVAANIETTQDLPLINGTDVPANQSLVNTASELIALGSGAYGTYTMSDFLGSMSGLPYPWKTLMTQISLLETGPNNSAAALGGTLYEIYENLYNAVTAASPVMLTIQGFIDQADAEISAIRSRSPLLSNRLNTVWDLTGKQLTIEQRARYTALPPVPDPQDTFLSVYPVALYSFTDSMPVYSKLTNPHLYAQTLENISDWGTIGGQSIVGMMRESRNEERLAKIGITLDNNIPNTLDEKTVRVLLANGTVPGAIVGLPIQPVLLGSTPGTASLDNNTICPVATFTVPANSNTPVEVCAAGYWNPNDELYYVSQLPHITTNSQLGDLQLGSTDSTATRQGFDVKTFEENIWAGIISATPPSPPAPPTAIPAGSVTAAAFNLGPADNGTGPFGNGKSLCSDNNAPISVIRTGDCITVGEGIPVEFSPIVPGGLTGTPLPVSLLTGIPVEFSPMASGSLAGTPYKNLIPPNLNTLFTSKTLAPASYPIQEAIDQVIHCNCDCWIG